MLSKLHFEGSIFGDTYRKSRKQGFGSQGMVGKKEKTVSAQINISAHEVPDYLRNIYDFQTLLLSKDMTDQSKIEFIKDFFAKYHRLAVHQLEISMAIRPALFKQYVQIIEQLPEFILRTLPDFCSIPNPIFMILSNDDKIQDPEYEPKNGLFSFRLDLIYSDKGEMIFYKPFDIEENLADDNPDFFLSLSADGQLDFDKEYKIFGSSNEMTLIEASALYGASKCFKYFLLNNSKISRCAAAAVAGGSLEIIKILEQNKISFTGCEVYALIYRQDEVFDFIAKGTLKSPEKYIKNANTFSLKAMLALADEKGVELKETAAFIYMAEHNLIRGELIKGLESCSACFLATKSEELFNLFITENNVSSLFKAACCKSNISHIKAIINSDLFDAGKIKSADILAASKINKEIGDLIDSRMQGNGKVLYFLCTKMNSPMLKKSYEFTELNALNVFAATSYALSNGDFEFVSQLDSQTKLLDTLGEEELFKLAKFQSPVIIDKIIKFDQSTECIINILNIIDASCCKMMSTSLPLSSNFLTVALSNKDIHEKIGAKDVFKLVVMNHSSIVISSLLSFLVEKKYIQESLKITSKETLEEVVFTSEQFVKNFDVQYALSQLNSAQDILPFFTCFVMNEADFIKFNHEETLFAKKKNSSIDKLALSKVLKVNRKYISMIDDPILLDCVGLFELTNEEAQIIINKGNLSIFINNASNKKYLTTKQLIRYEKLYNLRQSLDGKELSQDEIGLIVTKVLLEVETTEYVEEKMRKMNKNYPSSISRKLTYLHNLLAIKELINAFPEEVVIDNLLVNNQFDSISLQIAEEYLKTKHPGKNIFMFYKKIKDSGNAQNETIINLTKKYADNLNKVLVSDILCKPPKDLLDEDGTFTTKDSWCLYQMVHSHVNELTINKLNAPVDVIQDAIKICIDMNDFNSMMFLLSTKLDIGVQKEFGAMLFHIAISQGKYDIVRSFIDCGASVSYIFNNLQFFDKKFNRELNIISPLSPLANRLHDALPLFLIHKNYSCNKIDAQDGSEFVENEIHQYSNSQLIRAINKAANNQDKIVLELATRQLNLAEFYHIPLHVLQRNADQLSKIIAEQSNESRVLYSACSGVDLLPEVCKVQKGTFLIAARRGYDNICSKLLCHGIDDDEIEYTLLEALTSSSKNINLVKICLDGGFDPNHIFYVPKEQKRGSPLIVTSFLNLCISAGEDFFDLIMKYHPKTSKVADKSPLEEAFAKNVSFMDKVLPLADETYLGDKIVVQSLKYINLNPQAVNDIDFKVDDLSSHYLFASNVYNNCDFLCNYLYGHKVILYKSNILESVAYKLPDEFESKEAGFFCVNGDKVYSFTNVDTILVDHHLDNNEIKAVAANFMKNHSECRILMLETR